MSIITDVIESTKAIIQGMGVTLSYIPKRKWTVQYPDEPVTVQPRYRGQHVARRRAGPRKMCRLLSMRRGVSIGVHLHRRRRRSASG